MEDWPPIHFLLANFLPVANTVTTAGLSKKICKITGHVLEVSRGTLLVERQPTVGL